MESSKGDLLIALPLGPFKAPTIFLVDTGAQLSALWAEEAACSGTVTDKK